MPRRPHIHAPQRIRWTWSITPKKSTPCPVLPALRRRVTSPNGTTEQALLSFERDDLRQTVARAMQACTNRSIELAQELGN